MTASNKSPSPPSTIVQWSIALVLLITAIGLPSGHAATCPFNIPVVTLPPHSEGGFSWGTVIQPMGDACVASIAVAVAKSALLCACAGNTPPVSATISAAAARAFTRKAGWRRASSICIP